MKLLGFLLGLVSLAGFCLADCNVNRLVKGKPYETISTGSSQECLYLCKMASDNCVRFMHDGYNTCSFYSKVDGLINCTNCVSGDRNCTLQLGNRVATNIGRNLSQSEIVDLVNPNLQCSSLLQPFWFDGIKVEDFTGGHLDGGVPIVCGGIFSDLDNAVSNECYVFDKNRNQTINPEGFYGPKLLANMKVERYGAASVTLPEHPDKLFITGGADKNYKVLDSTELVSLSGKFTRGPKLQAPLIWHCIVNLNSTHGFIAGGSTIDDSSPALSQTFILDYARQTWQSLETTPSLSFPRKKHSCTKYFTTDADQRVGDFVFVAGGMMSGSSLFELSMDIPEICSPSLSSPGCVPISHLRLPRQIQLPTMIPALDGTNSLYILGGTDLEYGANFQMFESRCNNTIEASCSWRKLDQELKFQIVGPIMLVPDFMTSNCINKTNPDKEDDSPMLDDGNACKTEVDFKVLIAVDVVVVVTAVLLISLFLRKFN